jgi:uncharacterized membrane protein
LKFNTDVSEEQVVSFFKEQGFVCYLLYAGLLLGLFFDPEYEGDIFLRNLG